jgi:RNA polymerase sigma factor (sigma-70 family)
MDEREWLAIRFEENRAHLRAVAVQILGSPAEADDAVQDTWLRLSRSDASAIENLCAWLATAVARVCLNMLQSRRSRREEPFGDSLPEPIALHPEAMEPEHQALVSESVGLALLVVLETLTPPERVAFVLHDVFAVPFDEIAPVVGRSPVAARKLASRARRRVRGASVADLGRERHREVVTAFLAAARGGEFDTLLALLDPEAVVRADQAGVHLGAAREVRGANLVAGVFAGRSHGARPALVNGTVGAVWARGGTPRVVFDFTIVDGKIAEICLIADPERIAKLELAYLDD